MRKLHLTLLAAAAVLGLAACGGGSTTTTAGSSTSQGGAEQVSSTTPENGCGSVNLPAVKDPDGVVAQLPAENRAAYRGYPYVVHKSPWADWRPKGEPPYRV